MKLFPLLIYLLLLKFIVVVWYNAHMTFLGINIACQYYTKKKEEKPLGSGVEYGKK